jgi:hypothetical protein
VLALDSQPVEVGEKENVKKCNKCFDNKKMFISHLIQEGSERRARERGKMKNVAVPDITASPSYLLRAFVLLKVCSRLLLAVVPSREMQSMGKIPAFNFKSSLENSSLLFFFFFIQIPLSSSFCPCLILFNDEDEGV